MTKVIMHGCNGKMGRRRQELRDTRKEYYERITFSGEM